MVILLARHGETRANAQGKILGRGDSPLTRTGAAQMDALARAAAPFAPAALYSSPLGRALTSAEILGRRLGLDPRPLPGLAELGCGEWEGLARNEVLHVAGPLRASWNARPPSGESCAQAEERAAEALAVLLAAGREGRPVLAVGHAGVNRVLLRLLLGLETQGLLVWTQGHETLLLAEPPDIFRVDAAGARHPGLREQEEA